MDERLEQLLGELERSLSLARKLVALDLEDFISDFRNSLALRYLVVEIAETIVNVCLHVSRSRRLGEPTSYREALLLMLRNGFISSQTFNALAGLLKLRNIIVHRYWEVDDAKLYSEARGGGLDAIAKFVEEVRSRVDP